MSSARSSVPSAPSAPQRVLDLGSGGGIPGLVLAGAWPTTHFTLLDAQHRRGEFLLEALAALGWHDRVGVTIGRAEELGRGVDRGSYDLVVARGFGPPGVTAECGAAFLAPGGLLLVAEPPGGSWGRWPHSGLSQLGLSLVGMITEPASIAILGSERPLDARFPRRTGIPAKRPLWSAAEPG